MSGKYLKKKKNWFLRHKIITVVLIVILLLIALIVGYIWSKLSLIQYEDEIPQPQATEQGVSATEPEETEAVDLQVDISGLEISETKPPIPEVEIEKKDEVVNILLIGTDERSKELNVNARSDSMIIVSINKDDKTVKLVSLERGMGVPILEGMYEGEWDLLTHVFRYGGADLLVKTVEHCFKVEIDHYVRVNFYAVVEAIDAIGGIHMELTRAEAQALTDKYHSPLHAGDNYLDGRLTLGFARLRSIDSDWQRVERQRKVILATVDALKDSSLTELDNLLDQVLPLVQTNMSMLEIADLMLYSPNFLNSTFDQMTIPKQGTYGGMTGLNGTGLFAVDFEVNNQILKDFLYSKETGETTPTE